MYSLYRLLCYQCIEYVSYIVMMKTYLKTSLSRIGMIDYIVNEMCEVNKLYDNV